MPRTLRDAAFQTFWRLRRPLTIGVRGVVVDAAGWVLLIRHTYTPGWHFPGGGIEPKENVGDGLLRELKEEAGITPTRPPVLVSVHNNHAFFPGDHVLVYRIDHWERGEATSRGEIAETGFFDPASPPEGVTRGTAKRLKELFEGAPPDPLW